MRTIHLLRKYNPDEWGGTETAIQRLFDGLREHGVGTVAYCPALEHSPAKDPLAAAGHQVERFHAFMPIWGISARQKRQLVALGGNLMSFDLVAALWRETDAAIIHTHTLGRIGAIGRTVAVRRQVPFVITIHGGVLDLPPEMKRSLNQPVAGGWEWGRFFGLLFQSHRLFRDADAVVTCNQNEARLLREKHPQKRIVVQPHGIPVELYRLDRRGDAQAAFPQISGRQVLLCVGRIDSIKNQGWLVEQAPAIFQKYPRALLVLAGACTEEAYGETLRDRIARLGLQERVLLTGGLPPNDPRLIGLMQFAEAVILPSISETFGLAILEAWAAGTMVLSSRTSGASALIRHGENGWLFDLDRPETFHSALDETLTNGALARRAAQCGGEQVGREYDTGAVAGRMKRLYEELIEEKHALRNHSR